MALAGSYLDLDGFRARTIAPASMVRGEHIDPSGDFDTPQKAARLAEWNTFIEAKLVSETSWINARLSKRYATPFAAPVLEVVLGWLAMLVTPFVYRKRGIDASDEQMVSAEADATRTREDITKAADAVDGLYDLPLRQNTTSSGIAKGGPLGYSETTPYALLDRQAEALQ